MRLSTKWRRAEVAALLFGVLACRPTPQYPATLTDAAQEEVCRRHSCLDVLDLTDAASARVRVLLLPDGPSDYKLVFYRAEKDTLRRVGAEFNLAGFTQPVLEQRERPTIVTRHQATSEPFHFAISADRIDLIPDQGTWEPVGQRADTTFTSQRCGIAFRHPSDWVVLADSMLPNEPCQFSLRPRDWEQRLVADDSVDMYGISMRIAAHGVATELPQSSFERRGDRWVVLGRHGMEAPADTVIGDGWRGVRGTATVGCFREGGGYVGLCEIPTAVVGTENRSATLFGATQSEDIFERVLATLRFL